MQLSPANRIFHPPAPNALEASQFSRCDSNPWPQYASVFDLLLQPQPYYQEMMANHLAFLADSEPLKICDMGAGTGNFAARAVAKRSGHSVIAVDQSVDMLSHLARKIRSRLLQGIQIEVGTAEFLWHIPEDSFDLVNFQTSLFPIANPRAALDEATRLLKPGGRIVLTEPTKTFDLDHLLHEIDNNLRLRRDDWVRENLFPQLKVANLAIRPSNDGRFTAEDAVAYLSLLEFNDLETTSSHLGECLTITAVKAEH